MSPTSEQQARHHMDAALTLLEDTLGDLEQRSDVGEAKG